MIVPLYLDDHFWIISFLDDQFRRVDFFLDNRVWIIVFLFFSNDQFLFVPLYIDDQFLIVDSFYLVSLVWIITVLSDQSWIVVFYLVAFLDEKFGIHFSILLIMSG